MPGRIVVLNGHDRRMFAAASRVPTRSPRRNEHGNRRRTSDCGLHVSQNAPFRHLDHRVIQMPRSAVLTWQGAEEHFPIFFRHRCSDGDLERRRRCVPRARASR